jgi:hypothetical protein
MYTNNKTPKKLGLTIEIFFFASSPDLPITARNAVFAFLRVIMVEEVRHFI